nr:hypothetical protein Iba_chr15cCG7560 [Ipomoea batatas]
MELTSPDSLPHRFADMQICRLVNAVWRGREGVSTGSVRIIKRTPHKFALPLLRRRTTTGTPPLERLRQRREAYYTGQLRPKSMAIGSSHRFSHTPGLRLYTSTDLPSVFAPADESSNVDDAQEDGCCIWRQPPATGMREGR